MNKKIKLLIVDDDTSALRDMELTLAEKKELYEVDSTAYFEEAKNKLKYKQFDILITDLILLENSGIDLIKLAKQNNSTYGNILITGYSNEAAIIEAAKLGVTEILKKPFSEVELFSAIERLAKMQTLEEENMRLAEKLKKENIILKKELDKKVKTPWEIIGESPKLLYALKKARQIAEYQLHCIIGGESGTGKELLAKYIHDNGPRKHMPFVEVNCAAISPSLFEAELFGYKKGSFTNATENHSGFFEVANGGVLFLDEITELPFDLQAKLLTAVEQKFIRRIGDTKNIEIDVQIIAATNRSLDSLVSENHLRRDLYHRLSQTTIILPPLRERGNDIKILLDYYTKQYEEEFNKKADPMPEALWEKIITYDWPGNIRQLTNFIKKWVLFGEDSLEEIEKEDVLFNEEFGDDEIERILSFDFIKGNFEELEYAKKLLIKTILKKYNGNKSKTARHLGLTYPGLLKMLKKYAQTDESFAQFIDKNLAS